MTTKHENEARKTAARARLGDMVRSIAIDLYDHGLLDYGVRLEVATERASVKTRGSDNDPEAYGNNISTDDLTPADLVDLHVAILARRAEADAQIREAAARLAAEAGAYDAIAPDTEAA